MAISIIRTYDTEYKARVKAAAERFCARHGIEYDADCYFGAENSIDYAIFSAHPLESAYLRKLWTACYCRALRVPTDVRTTTACGYIGVSVK